MQALFGWEKDCYKKALTGLTIYETMFLTMEEEDGNSSNQD